VPRAGRAGTPQRSRPRKGGFDETEGGHTMRGDGRIFRDPGSRFWFMAYYLNGKQVRQSTGEVDERRARRVLRRRISEVLRGEVIPNEQRVTVGDLKEMLIVDYQVNGRRSLDTIRYPLRHVMDYFGERTKANSITTDGIERFILARREQGAANASIR